MSKDKTQPQKKNVGHRIFALILLAVSVASLFVPIHMLTYADKSFGTGEQTIINALTARFEGGFSPFIAEGSTIAALYGVFFYALIALLAVSAIACIVAIFTKKAPAIVRFACGLLCVGFAMYTLGFYLFTQYLHEICAGVEVTYDFVAIALTAVFAILYFVLALAKNGKKAWLSLLHLLLTLVYTAAIAIVFVKDSEAASKALDAVSAGKALAIGVVVWVVINALLSVHCLQNGKHGSIVRSIISFVALLCLAYAVSKMEGGKHFIWIGVAAVAVVLQFVIVISRSEKQHKKALKLTEEEIHQSFTTEQYAEAEEYKGGPVAGVVKAAEVNPSDLAYKTKQKAYTAGYDFFNCKSYDPFIAMLDDAERREFTELFILGWKGVMPEIPEYVVGGDNKDFFQKLFIYLGQYRDRISSKLLSKIYQFSTKQMF